MNSKHIKRDEKRWRERYKREKVREREREEKWERERGEREFYVEKHLRRDRDSKKKPPDFALDLPFPQFDPPSNMNFLSTTPNFRKSEICQMARTLGGAPFVKQNFCLWMCIRKTSKGSLLLLGTLVTCTLNWSSATNENEIYGLCLKNFLSKSTA